MLASHHAPTTKFATGLAVSAWTGRVSHPLDDKHDFWRSALSFLRDQPYLVASRNIDLTDPQDDRSVGIWTAENGSY